jgi:hypothetical protein
VIILRLVLLSVALLFCVEKIYAHAGGVDSSGCHHNKKAGGQHCHKSNVTVQPPPQILKPVNEQSNGSEHDSAKNDGEIEQIQSNDGKSSELPDGSSKKSYPPNNDIDKEVIKKIQQLLKKGGYNLVLVDGILGRKTLKAITQFQKDNGLDKDGIPSNSLLMKLHEKYEGSK